MLRGREAEMMITDWRNGRQRQVGLPERSHGHLSVGSGCRNICLAFVWASLPHSTEYSQLCTTTLAYEQCLSTCIIWYSVPFHWHHPHTRWSEECSSPCRDRVWWNYIGLLVHWQGTGMMTIKPEAHVTAIVLVKQEVRGNMNAWRRPNDHTRRNILCFLI